MRTPSEAGMAWVEQKIGRLLTPNGLMTVIFLIFLSVFVLSGGGIEHRTMDSPEVDASRGWTSPLLGNN